MVPVSCVRSQLTAHSSQVTPDTYNRINQFVALYIGQVESPPLCRSHPDLPPSACTLETANIGFVDASASRSPPHSARRGHHTCTLAASRLCIHRRRRHPRGSHLQLRSTTVQHTSHQQWASMITHRVCSIPNAYRPQIENPRENPRAYATFVFAAILSVVFISMPLPLLRVAARAPSPMPNTFFTHRTQGPK